MSGNPAVAAGNYVTVTVYPITNPPSLQPLYPFGMWTGDLDGDKTEIWDTEGDGVSLTDLIAGEF